MDSKSSDGSNAHALAPVLGDGEVDLRKRGIRKKKLGYFLSQVKKWGCEASLSNSAQPRCFSSIDPPLTQPRHPGMRQCRHINSSSESPREKNNGVVDVVVVGWGCLGDRIGASTPRRLRHRLSKATH